VAWYLVSRSVRTRAAALNFTVVVLESRAERAASTRTNQGLRQNCRKSIARCSTLA
jgi:hypothetical protein